MKLIELMAGITKGRRYVGAPIRSGDTLGINVQHNEDGGESYEETIAEVIPSTKEGQQKADAYYLAHCANHLPALVSELETMILLASGLINQSATHDGLRNCKALANARATLAAAQEVEI
jgi:hypothetical protein